MTFKWLIASLADFVWLITIICSLPGDKHLVQIRKQINEYFFSWGELCAHVLHGLETVNKFSVKAKANMEEKQECCFCKYYKNWYQLFIRLRTPYISHSNGSLIYYLLDWIFQETLIILRIREREKEIKRLSEHRRLRHAQKSGLLLIVLLFITHTTLIFGIFRHIKYSKFFTTVAEDLFIGYI